MKRELPFPNTKPCTDRFMAPLTDWVYSVAISVTLVPCKLLCLVSLLVSQALVENAFDPEFNSFNELLTRPMMGNEVDYLPLRWKEEVLDDLILTISSSQYWKIW